MEDWDTRNCNYEQTLLSRLYPTTRNCNQFSQLFQSNTYESLKNTKFCVGTAVQETQKVQDQQPYGPIAGYPTYPSHSGERCISPPPIFLFSSPFLIFPRSLEACNPPFWHPSQENTRFYDEKWESGRLEIINHGNLLPRETVYLKYWMCPNRYHSNN